MATISTNDIKIRYDIDLSKLQQATSEFDRITAEERQLLAELGKLKKQLDDVGDKAKKAGKDTGDAFGGMGAVAAKVGPVIAGIFAADKIVGFTKEVIAVTAQFQKFESVLKNTLGSNSAAQGALASIKQFAATTPFSVQEVTDSFVKLAGVGFKPTIDQMRKLGDVASSQGKSFLQFTEAILDARNFEFERLKELNISARTVGENVIFNFKGVETQVKKNRDAVQAYLLSLGDYNGVAGASSAVSQTLGGQISNLGDTWDSLLNTIGNNLAPVFGKALTVTAEFLGALNDLFKGDAQKAQEFIGGQYTAYTNFFAKTSDEALKNIEINSRRNIAIKEKELKDLKVKAAEERAIREQVAAESRVAVDIGAGRLEVLAKKEEKYLEALKAQNQAAIDEINKRAKAAAAASVASQTEDKAQYQSRLKLLELEKQQQVLMAQLRGSKLGEVGAEKVFQEAVFQLKKEYSTKNIGIIEDEVKVAKLLRDKAAKDYEEAAKKELLVTKEVKVKVAEEDKTLYDKRLSQMKDWQKAYEDDLKNQVEKEKEAAKIKEEIRDKAYQLGQEIIAGGFDLYQRNLSNEMTLLQRRYDEEVRLADGNQQKLTQLEEKKRLEEKDIRTKQFRAEQLQAVANVLFSAAPEIIKYAVSAPPLAAIVAALAATQTGLILAQPVPEFAEGTKGKPFKGGKAIVGERGVEKVVTESGKVYFTPGTATLMDLPKGSQVIPNHALSRQELFLANHYANRNSSSGSPVVGEIRELGSILKSLPITQLSMDERGFEKFIRTPRRTTKILNNRFRTDS
jgi:uncharacterized protein YbjQ (UPF0145 family)